MVVFVVETVVDNSNTPDNTGTIVSEEETGLGMFIERIPFWVQPDAFIYLQRWHPLGDVPVNMKRQAKEVSDLFFIGEVDLGDIHKKVERDESRSTGLHSLCAGSHL